MAGFSLATVATALPAVASVDFRQIASADAALLALGRELAQSWAREEEVLAAIPSPHTIESEAPYEAAFDASALIADEIEATPATTFDGLLVKARAIAWCMAGRPLVLDNWQGTTNLRLAQDVLSTLLAMGSTAHA